MEDNFRKMAPGAQTPAYFVTVIKDKTPKGFYWMANTNKSYDMLKAALKTAGLNMDAAKAPLDYTKEVHEYMEQTVQVLKGSIPELVAPKKVE